MRHSQKIKAAMAAVLVALTAIVALAGPAEAKATKLFDGGELRVKPVRLTGWTGTGEQDTDPVYVAGRSGNPREGTGPIEWISWDRGKAVGIGRGWTVGCPGACSNDDPWNGGKVRVTAYAAKGGSFRKLKVFQWTAWMKNPADRRENYTMKLQVRGGEWTVTSVDDGRPASSAVATNDIELPTRSYTTGDSNLVSAGDELWYETTSYSYKKRIWQAEVLRHRSSGGWERLPTFKKVWTAGTTYFDVRETGDGTGTLPCLGGFSLNDGKPGARVDCLEDGEWKGKSIDPSLRGMRLSGLDATGPQFTVMFTNWDNSRLAPSERKPRIVLGKIEGDQVVPLGPPLNLKKRFWAQLGNSTPGAEPVTADIIFQNSLNGKHSLATLAAGRWSIVPMPRNVRETGSGPVRTSAGVYANASGVNDFATRVYRFSDGVWNEVKGDSSGPGPYFDSASLSPVGDEVWLSTVTFYSDGERQYKEFLTATPIDGPENRLARPYRLSPRHPVTTYPAQIAEYQGGPVFLYERLFGRDGKDVVDFSFAGSGRGR